MKLPIQAQPVMRMPISTVGIMKSFGVAASAGGLSCGPFTNCPSGYWCCGNKDGSGVGQCTPCPTTGLFGECLSTASGTCEGVGKVHWS